MSYAKLRNDLLATRDTRQSALDRFYNEGHWPTLVTLCLNIPGRDKNPEGSAGLWQVACDRLIPCLSPGQVLLETSDLLGPWLIAGCRVPAVTTKRWSLEIEMEFPAGRLLDIDVYGFTGKPLDRSSLGIAQRSCLLCSGSARDCMRLGRHRPSELRDRVNELLRPFIAE